MKRLLLSMAVLLGAITVPPPPVLAQGETAVTGAGEAVFPDGAELYGVPLRGFEFVNGVSISGDGSATGEFQVLLRSTGPEQASPSMIVEGRPDSGHASPDGSATFEGVANVDFGSGQIRAGVPFTATVTAEGLELSIDSAVLPAATVTLGSVTVRMAQ